MRSWLETELPGTGFAALPRRIVLHGGVTGTPGVQDAKRAARKAKQKEKDRARKQAAQAAAPAVSRADEAEDEVARAALEAVRISEKCANCLAWTRPARVALVARCGIELRRGCAAGRGRARHVAARRDEAPGAARRRGRRRTRQPGAR